MASSPTPASAGPPSDFLHPASVLQANFSHDWSTTTTDCLKDEETCWWGTWCCCLLAARTTETFSLGNAREQIYFVIGIAIAVFLCLQFGLPLISLFILLGGALMLVFRRSSVRTGIRAALRIPGSYFNDFLLHFCCSCCSVCQEAREAKIQNLKVIDFCSGQELAELAVQGAELSNEDATDDVVFDTHLFYSLSQASQLILKLCGVFLLYIAARLAVTNPTSLGVLMVIFIQPIFILYYFYWRKRRHHAQLDYVVKLFAIGFFMATTQSMLFELILQYAITILAGIVFFLVNPHALSSNSTASVLWGSLAAGIEKFSPRSNFALYSPERHAFDSVINIYSLHGGQSFDYFQNAMQADESATDDMLSGLPRSLLRRNIWLLLIVLFLFAFVVAAGVEETMKHFVVRCCRFPAPLKDPDMILVYLLTGALGFATAENIEYVFGTKSSPIQGTSIYVGELFVLFLRICMPIHLICAVLQAANLSRVVLGGREMNILHVLLPALILHGSFDFFLFVAGAVQFVYNINSATFELVTFIFPFIITVAGVVAAKMEFDSVMRQYRSTWQPLAQEDDVSVHNDILSASV